MSHPGQATRKAETVESRPGALGPSHLVMACAWALASATSRGVPSAMLSWAIESSVVRTMLVPSSPNQ